MHFISDFKILGSKFSFELALRDDHTIKHSTGLFKNQLTHLKHSKTLDKARTYALSSVFQCVKCVSCDDESSLMIQGLDYV